MNAPAHGGAHLSDSTLRKYAVWCAAQVREFLGPDCRRALGIAWLHADGKTSDGQLNAAWQRATLEALRVPSWDTSARYASWAAVSASTASVSEAALRAPARAGIAHPDPIKFIAERSAKYRAVMAAGEWV